MIVWKCSLVKWKVWFFFSMIYLHSVKLSSINKILPTLVSVWIIPAHRLVMAVDENIAISGWQHERCWVQDIYFSNSSIWADSRWIYPVVHGSRDCYHIGRHRTLAIAQLHRSQPAPTIAQLIAIRQSSYYKNKSQASVPQIAQLDCNMSTPHFVAAWHLGEFSTDPHYKLLLQFINIGPIKSAGPGRTFPEISMLFLVISKLWSTTRLESVSASYSTTISQSVKRSLA